MKSLRVGALLFPGFELLDIYGPLEMFGMLGRVTDMQVEIVMLAERAGIVASAQGPGGVADVDFPEAGACDVLLVPGGPGARREVDNPALLEALRGQVERSRLVASICTGAALLARAGLLDGLRATSNKAAFDWVRSQGPCVTWVREARWVRDGRIYTSSGVSAGMDMTLGLIAEEFGRDLSLRVARRAEYLWNEDAGADPFA
ncbi:MAG: DJ-1/PfpI family protein [Opitutaceae bacterium]|jgi:transcriptional regulator GlxA family with amidase domain